MTDAGNLPQTLRLVVSAKRISPQQGNARAIWGIALLCFLLSARTWSAVEHSSIPLFSSEAVQRIPADTRTKSIFFQLPEHVLIETNSELRLVLLPASVELPGDLFTLTLALNGVTLLTRPAAEVPKAARERVELTAQVGEAAARGWNRIDIGFVAPKGITNDLSKTAWFLSEPECKLALAFSRLPMFPELGRFPATFAEEKLVQTQPRDPLPPQRTVTLVLPRVLRDVHLRAIAVIAARFGQVSYFTEQDYGLALTDLGSWKPSDENSIVIGNSEDVGQSAALTNIARLSKPLQAAQGLIAESSIGSTEVPHRCLLVSGADDAGLEKALLLLSNSKALATIGPTPVIVTESLPLPNVASQSLPAKIDGLNQTAQFLVPDPLLQRLAFVVPLDSSADALRLLADLALFAGHSLASSPALWPEACGYEINRPPLRRGCTANQSSCSARRSNGNLPCRPNRAFRWKFPTRSNEPREFKAANIPSPPSKQPCRSCN